MIIRGLRSFGLILGFLTSALLGIDYPVNLYPASARYTNEAGTSFSTNTTNEVLLVSEMPLSHFLIVTNGLPIYAASNFTLTLRGVDAWGYHVTITNPTNLGLGSFDSNRAPSFTNLFSTQLPYVSPSQTNPDFAGVTFTNSYPVPGLIFISVVQTNTTNFDNPGLLTVLASPVAGILTFDRPRYLSYGARALLSLADSDRNGDPLFTDSVSVRVFSTSDTNGKWVSLVETGANTGVFTNEIAFEGIQSPATNRLLALSSNTISAEYTDPLPPLTFTTNSRFDLVSQIWVNHPIFMGPSRSTNLKVLGITPDGFTNEITRDYALAASTENGTSLAVSVLATNEVTTLTPGLGRIWLSNFYDTALNTNTVFLVTVPPDTAAGLSAPRMGLALPPGVLPDETWFDVRHTTNWSLVYPVANGAPGISAATEKLTAGAYLLPASTHMVTALGSNLVGVGGNFAVAPTATLYYDSADLTNAGAGSSGRLSPDSFQVVRLNEQNLWVPLPLLEHQKALMGLRFTAPAPGVYGILATLSRQPTSFASVSLYPSPFDLRKAPDMFLLNLPPDVTVVRIYAADSTLVRTLRAPSDIGYKDIDGKVFRSARWDGRGEGGNFVKMGLYFAEVTSASGSVVKKLMVVR